MLKLESEIAEETNEIMAYAVGEAKKILDKEIGEGHYTYSALYSYASAWAEVYINVMKQRGYDKYMKSVDADHLTNLKEKQKAKVMDFTED